MRTRMETFRNRPTHKDVDLTDFEYYVLVCVQDAPMFNCFKDDVYVRVLGDFSTAWIKDNTKGVLMRDAIEALLDSEYLKPVNKPVKLKTKVVHSMSKQAWNVIGTELESKFKIAQVPYVDVSTESKEEARLHALFISFSFNNQK